VHRLARFGQIPPGEQRRGLIEAWNSGTFSTSSRLPPLANNAGASLKLGTAFTHASLQRSPVNNGGRTGEAADGDREKAEISAPFAPVIAMVDAFHRTQAQADDIAKR
jgi:hypothetical protein